MAHRQVYLLPVPVMDGVCNGCSAGCRTRQEGPIEFDRRGLRLVATLCFGLPLLALLLSAVVTEALLPEFPAAPLLGLIAVTGMISRLTTHVEAWLAPKSRILGNR